MLAAANIAQPRVLIIPPSYFDRDRTIGGGERYALEYARALATLTPTTLGLFGRTPSIKQDGALTIQNFGVRKYSNSWLFPATFQTARALRQFDVVHAMIFPTPLTDFAMFLQCGKCTQVVLTDVGGVIPSLSTRLRRISRRMDINRRANGLAHLSRYAARPFSNWSQPQTVLYGGVHEPQTAVNTEPNGYALFVGRLLPHKGALELIESISPRIPLRIVGRPYNPVYYAKLRDAAAGKNVSFHTSADDFELREHYRHANVVIQPSVPSSKEGFDNSELLGLVALEGMSWGKPIVTTDTASLPELMVEGETGHIVRAYDRDALNEAICEFVDFPERSKEIGARAKQHVLTHYTWSAAARRGLDFYRVLFQ